MSLQQQECSFFFGLWVVFLEFAATRMQFFFFVSGWCFLSLQQQGCSFFGSPGGVTLVAAIRMQFFVSGWCFSGCSNKNRVSFSRQEEQNKSQKTPEKGFKTLEPTCLQDSS
jgi:hypothetical protein